MPLILSKPISVMGIKLLDKNLSYNRNEWICDIDFNSIYSIHSYMLSLNSKNIIFLLINILKNFTLNILLPEGILANGKIIFIINYYNFPEIKYIINSNNNHLEILYSNTKQEPQKIWGLNATENTLWRIENITDRCYYCNHSTDPINICIKCEQLLCENHMMQRTSTNTIEYCICEECYNFQYYE